jgi:23S rRNA (guanosine2251-2'-O)-methyltransferase
VAVVVSPRRFSSLDEILARAIARSEPAFVLALDSLEDPQNVGSLLRSAEAAGVHGVVFPTRRQAPLSPAAVKASAGAVEHLLLAPVDDLAEALTDLHVRGLRIVGAEEDAPLAARHADLKGPIALVVGSEGQGLGGAVRRRCDLLVRIPMRGAIGSLNAAVAGSVLAFEVLAQRDPEGQSRPSIPEPASTLATRPSPPTGEEELEVAPSSEEELPAAEPTDEGATVPADEPPTDSADESASASAEGQGALLPDEPA